MSLVTDPTPIGPVNKDWAQFFSEIASAALGDNAYADPTNQDSVETVAMLESATESWSWTESVVCTVTACPLPSTTLFPSTTLYPC